MKLQLSKHRHPNSLGFSTLELAMSVSMTLVILIGSLSVQKSSTNSMNKNEVESQPLDEISRIGNRLDAELRRANAGSLQVPGSPFPVPPVSGTFYTSISYRRVLYDHASAGSPATYLDADYSTLSLSGNSLLLDNGTITTTLVKDVSDFSVVYNGDTKSLTVSIQISKTPTGESSFSQKIIRTIFLRNG